MFSLGCQDAHWVPNYVYFLRDNLQSILYVNPRYVKLVEQYAPRHPPPEERLPMGVLGGIIFAICFFWFGWTSYPSVSYWAPLLSGVAFGVSLMFLFVSPSPTPLPITHRMLCSLTCQCNTFQ